jgi:Tol biopolymer transport system component
MIAADGTGFRELTSGANNNGFPSLSPDGERVVYRTLGPEGQGLRIKNLGDGSIATLTTEYDSFPLWSPASDEIMFTRKHRDDYDLFKINSDGTGLRQMTFSRGNDAHGVWSPDGQWFLFSSSRMGFKDEALYTDAPQPYTELFVVRRDGEDLRQLTDNQWEDGGPAWRPTVTK